MKLKPAGATTPGAYLESIDEPRRSDMVALHQLITKTVPKLTPHMVAGMIGYGTHRYKYASGREVDWPIIGLASQKQYISVYVCALQNGKYVAESQKASLPNANVGKSCIRFKRLSDVDTKALVRVIKLALKVMATPSTKKATAASA